MTNVTPGKGVWPSTEPSLVEQQQILAGLGWEGVKGYSTKQVFRCSTYIGFPRADAHTISHHTHTRKIQPRPPALGDSSSHSKRFQWHEWSYLNLLEAAA